MPRFVIASAFDINDGVAMTPAMVLVMIPAVTWTFVLRSPDTPLSLFLTLAVNGCLHLL